MYQRLADICGPHCVEMKRVANPALACRSQRLEVPQINVDMLSTQRTNEWRASIPPGLAAVRPVRSGCLRIVARWDLRRKARQRAFQSAWGSARAARR